MTKISKLTNLILLFVMLASFGNLRAWNEPAKEGVNETLQQKRRVTGVVSDNAGPVAGATVTIKGTVTGVITDLDGKYAIEVSNGQTLVFSFLGYTAQEVKYSSQATLDVTLVEDTQTIGEVVVTALGITKDAKKVGYAMTTISAPDLVKSGAPNAASALYGKIPGLRIATAPGGAAGGVYMNVRGLSTVMGSSQPLLVINGVPVRNGNTGDSGKDFSQFGFGGDDVIRSNGMTDINPEDIESLTVLKGAAATALYGSEAANGVIMITSKKAKGKGVTVDASVMLSANYVTGVPEIQTEYGPGVETKSKTASELQTGGFREYLFNKDGKTYTVPAYDTNRSWGPKFDGREVLYWDGKVRPYSPISSQPWKELFRTGFDQVYNVGINQGSDNANTRFSYTFMDEVPNNLNSTYNKHNFNVVGELKVSNTVKIDYSANYILQNFFNRARGITALYNSFSNMFNSFADIPLLMKMNQTSLGYKNVLAGEDTRTPDESFAMTGLGSTGGNLRDILWDTYNNKIDETDQRLISSVAPQWRLFDFLTLRGRVATDLTLNKSEQRKSSEKPISYGFTGEYGTMQKNYNVYYGDVMLMFDKNLTEAINLTANVGYQGRVENMRMLKSWTDGGLSVENMFLLTASRYQAKTEEKIMELLKTAWLGTIGVSYGNALFLEATGRYEKSSTLPKGSNTYFYPSVNAGFIYTESFREQLPEWYNHGKLRASLGIVGNAPEPYAANYAYEVGAANGFVWNHIPTTLGNSKLRPEKTTEFEVGLDNKLFKNRLGFDLSYYRRRVTDMIIQLPLAAGDGANNVWVNIGTLQNNGVELSLYGTPVLTKDFSWELRSSLSFNDNKMVELMDGVEYVENKNDGGGGVVVRSYAGQPMGDFYVYKPKKSPDGRPIISSENGLYDMDFSAPQRVANGQPKLIGGLGTTLTYKSWSVDVMTDFRLGGYVANLPYQYTMATGINPESMKYRDAEHGGLKYEYNGVTLNNGMILPGVKAVTDAAGNVSYVENDIIVPSDYYYDNTYNWGNDGNITFENSILENSYWKFRELSIAYRIPTAISSKLGMSSLSASVFGRNLFYLYKTMPNFDPEATRGGTRWTDQLFVGSSAAPTRTVGLSLRATF
ncbi:MAG: SusC/RagA family TonB-linked outer membrane protein [Tannerellaceae bacterium]|jgi:TonB-linked SusC/RagA family outer membrane protein|nr:SusC/RagA family TonB-linked outer membrane protein [Tannerellaceae bacterium]